MISLSQLEAWVQAGESETLEFKRSTGERRSATQTLCGMLNHCGGRVLFGVEADGRIIGQMVSDHTIEEVAQELREIDPPVFPSIERVDVSPGKQMVVVTIAQGSNRPYSYKGRAYRRVGNTTPELSRDEYRRGIIEAWGRGTIKIAEAMARAGLPRPEIEETGGCVTVRFAPSKYVPPLRVARDVTERQRAILSRLSESPEGIALREIRKAVDDATPEWEIKNDLAALKTLGLVSITGKGRGARWVLGG
jgi:predicted HTH transcriptional regulator